jgi:hypothetical protein
MAHRTGTNFVDSSPEIQVTPTGAQATNTCHSVQLLGDIAAPGAISLTTPEGKKIVSNVRGLTFLDLSTGREMWLALVTNSLGQLLPSHTEAVYPDCFAGSGIHADLLYANSLSSFEQLVVLQTGLPNPADPPFQMSAENTVVRVITAFSAPGPEITPGQINGVPDCHLDFGVMSIGRGFAFAIDSETNKVRVMKQWLKGPQPGTSYLAEQVPFQKLAPLLAQLPPPSPGSASLLPRTTNVLARTVPAASPSLPNLANHWHLQPPPLPPLKNPSPAFTVASAPAQRKGLAIDYTILTSQSNFTFRGDTVYLIVSNVNLSDSTVIEAGTAIKFSSNPTNYPGIFLGRGSLTCTTSPYGMAILTSSDDPTVGGGGGTTNPPTVVSNSTAFIEADGPGTPGTDWQLKYLRFSYALVGFAAYDGLDVSARDCQFVNSLWPLGALPGSYFTNGNLTAQNCLFANCAFPLYTDLHAAAINVTASGFTNFCQSEQGLLGLAATNTIAAASGGWVGQDLFVTNPPAPLLDHSIKPPGTNGLFQTSGAGNYYLADGSTNRNAGTTNIGALLAQLRATTTFPPLLYTNYLFADTTLAPQAQRDTDPSPALGYHYLPLDWLASCLVSNAVLTLTNGVALAYYNSGAISLRESSSLVSYGSPTSRNYLAHYTLVQEEPLNLNAPYGPAISLPINFYHTNLSLNPSLTLRFTTFAAPVNASYIFYTDSVNWNNSLCDIRNCEVFGGGALWEQSNPSGPPPSPTTCSSTPSSSSTPAARSSPGTTFSPPATFSPAAATTSPTWPTTAERPSPTSTTPSKPARPTWTASSVTPLTSTALSSTHPSPATSSPT